MPYSIQDNHAEGEGGSQGEPNGKPFAVVDDGGKVMGFHESAEGAVKQVAALVVGENRESFFTQLRKQFDEFLKRAANHSSFGEIIAPSPEAEFNSLMVSVPLDADVAGRLAVPGGEAAESLHITLAWAGDARQQGDDVLARAIVETAAIARRSRPLVGKVGGVAKFSADPDGRVPVVALVDVPGLSELRTELVACLKMSGVPVAENHGFTAHVTLRYDEGEGGELPIVERVSLLINSIAVSVGDKQAIFPLQNWMGYGPEVYSERDLMRLARDGGSMRLFNEVSFMEAPEWIPYLPVPGEYKHPEYGEIVITTGRNERFVDQFNAGVYQKQVPIDAEHQTALSGAMGWITRMRVNADGSADARVDWTDRGRKLLEDDRFKYFSPSWYDEWTDPATGEVFRDVAIGGGLTTRPFYKEGSLRPLMARERKIVVVPVDPGKERPGNETNEGGLTMSDELKFAELEKKLTEQGQQFAELKTQLAGETAARQAAEQSAKTLAEQNTALTERVSHMEKGARRKRFAEMVDGATPWYGAVETHLNLLEKLADTFGEDSEEFKTFVSQQEAQAKALADSALFQEQGSNRRATTDDPVGRVNQMAEAKVKAGMTLADAQAQVFAENPALYEQYRQRTAVKI